TEDALTIQDASEPFWKLAGSDLLLLATSDGNVLGFHVKKQGWSPRVAEADLKRSAEQGEDAAWWYADGLLYWVFLRPINVGPENSRKQLGVLAVGYQVDSTVAEQLALVSGSQIVLAVGDIVIALLFRLVSRTITHLLDNLVSGVRARAAGDYMFSITPRGSSEVAEVGEAFSKMRGELLASQRRWMAAERIAALGRAASSISR